MARDAGLVTQSLEAAAQASSVQYSRHAQGKFGDRSVEADAILGLHLVTSTHRAYRRRDSGATGVFEALLRLQQWLLTHDASAADLLHMVVRVRYDPVSADQPSGNSAAVGNGDRVGEHEARLLHVRLLGDKRRARGHGDVVFLGHVAIAHDFSQSDKRSDKQTDKPTLNTERLPLQFAVSLVLIPLGRGF